MANATAVPKATITALNGTLICAESNISTHNVSVSSVAWNQTTLSGRLTYQTLYPVYVEVLNHTHVNLFNANPGADVTAVTLPAGVLFTPARGVTLNVVYTQGGAYPLLGLGAGYARISTGYSTRLIVGVTVLGLGIIRALVYMFFFSEN